MGGKLREAQLHPSLEGECQVWSLVKRGSSGHRSSGVPTTQFVSDTPSRSLTLAFFSQSAIPGTGDTDLWESSLDF